MVKRLFAIFLFLLLMPVQPANIVPFKNVTSVKLKGCIYSVLYGSAPSCYPGKIYVTLGVMDYQRGLDMMADPFAQNAIWQTVLGTLASGALSFDFMIVDSLDGADVNLVTTGTPWEKDMTGLFRQIFADGNADGKAYVLCVMINSSPSGPGKIELMAREASTPYDQLINIEVTDANGIHTFKYKSDGDPGQNIHDRIQYTGHRASFNQNYNDAFSVGGHQGGPVGSSYHGLVEDRCSFFFHRGLAANLGWSDPEYPGDTRYENPDSIPPTLTLIEPSKDTMTLYEMDSIKFRVAAKGLTANDTIVYVWFVNSINQGSDRTSDSFWLKPPLHSAGIDSITVTASNGKAFVSHTWIATVLHKGIPPVPLLPQNGKSMQGDSLLSWLASGDPDLNGANYYRIQFATDYLFSTIIALAEGLTATSTRLNGLSCYGQLPPQTILFWRIMAYDSSGYSTGYSKERNYFYYSGAGLSIENSASGLPNSFILGAARPNPCNPLTSILYAVPPSRNSMDQARRVVLCVYDQSGRKVASLVDGLISTGWHQAAFNGRTDDGKPLGAGIYFYRMESDGFACTRPVVFLK